MTEQTTNTQDTQSVAPVPDMPSGDSNSPKSKFDWQGLLNTESKGKKSALLPC